MSIWHITPTLEQLAARSQNTLISHLGIEFTEIGDDHLTARMPVDERTLQPLGLLHGGANAALAETVGSVAGNLCVDMQEKICVGLEINANHLRPARHGWVTGTARPIHLGASTQVWEIRITDEQGNLTCISRLTLAVIQRRDR